MDFGRVLEWFWEAKKTIFSKFVTCFLKLKFDKRFESKCLTNKRQTKKLDRIQWSGQIERGGLIEHLGLTKLLGRVEQ